MKYCKFATTEHPIAKSYPCFLQTMDSIIEKESEELREYQFQFIIQKVINLDKVEECIAKKNHRDFKKTVDAVFGVSDNEKNCQMVLCEYKLNIKNPENLKEKELSGKIKGSKEILGESPQIHKSYLFVFSDNIKQQAYSRIRRLDNNSKGWLALTLDELKEKFF